MEEKKADLRWLAVLPAAVLGAFVAGILGGIVASVAVPARMLEILMVEFPKGVALVIVGARTAPRRRFLTATVLAILWSLLSVTIHVLKVETPGPTNIIAAVMAFIAAAGAAVFIYFQERRLLRSEGATTNQPTGNALG